MCFGCFLCLADPVPLQHSIPFERDRTPNILAAHTDKTRNGLEGQFAHTRNQLVRSLTQQQQQQSRAALTVQRMHLSAVGLSCT